jgi:hypothetical protein
MIIYVKIIKKNHKKKTFLRTDRRTIQNYSSEPLKEKMFFIRTDRQTDTRLTQNYSSEPHKSSVT